MCDLSKPSAVFRAGRHAPAARRRATVALCVFAALTMVHPAVSRAQTFEIMPVVGWAWGGTQEFTLEPLRGSVHVDAATEYGVSLVGYGHDYAAEIIYTAQPSKAVVRVDGFGDIGSVDMSFHYILLQLMRQKPMGSVIPFASVGFGAAGFYAAGDNQWEFGFSAGGGIRKRFANGGSLRLTVRLLVPLEVVDNGFSFGAAGSGLGIGGPNALYQGDASLGYSFPIWTLR